MRIDWMSGQAAPSLVGLTSAMDLMDAFHLSTPRQIRSCSAV